MSRPGVQRRPQFLALAFGIGAGLAELACGFLAGPVSVGAELFEFTRGVVASFLSGVDEGGSVGVSALDRLPRLRLDVGCPVACGADLRVGLGAGLLDLGCGLAAALVGFGPRVSGALVSLPACGFGGLEFPVHFHCRAPCLLGVGFGLLPALGLAGDVGLGVGDLLGCFGLHGLDLRGGCFGVGGPVQLRREFSELAGQRGHVGADPVAQFRRPCGGHGDRPSQILGLGAAGRVSSWRRRNAVSAVCGLPVSVSGWPQYFGFAPAPSSAARGSFSHPGYLQVTAWSVFITVSSAVP